MNNIDKIVNLYNDISDNKLDESEMNFIIPKLNIIIDKVKLDEIEIIKIIDTLIEIKNKELLDKINPEIIDLIIRITKKDKIDLSGTLYFSVILKHVILPYNKNICDKDYNILLYLSEFEILIELASKMLNEKDLEILEDYNYELKELIVKYKEAMKKYYDSDENNIVLSTMISHFASLIYFYSNEYYNNYDLLVEIVERILNNYQNFVKYCYDNNLDKNFMGFDSDLRGIEKEYIISNDILKYLHNSEKTKIKRK